VKFDISAQFQVAQVLVYQSPLLFPQDTMSLGTIGFPSLALLEILEKLGQMRADVSEIIFRIFS
jgi:hypothetical protein